MKNSKLRRYAACIPAVSIAAAIFYFSAQPADISTDMSDGVSRLLLKIGSALGIFQGPPEDYYELIEKMSMPVRKSAHVTEYLVFYLALVFALYHWDFRGRKLFGTAFMLTVFYACTDEFHQLFVPGRSGQVKDVLIDSSGAFLATAAAWLRTGKKKKD